MVEHTTIDVVLKVLEFTGYVLIPFVIKGVADVRDIFRKIDAAKKPDSDGGEVITMDEIAEIIGEAGIVAKFILNGVKKYFTQAKEIIK